MGGDKIEDRRHGWSPNRNSPPWVEISPGMRVEQAGPHSADPECPTARWPTAWRLPPSKRRLPSRARAPLSVGLAWFLSAAGASGRCGSSRNTLWREAHRLRIRIDRGGVRTVEYRSIERRDLNGVLDICRAEGWLSYTADPQAAWRAFTAAGESTW